MLKPSKLKEKSILFGLIGILLMTRLSFIGSGLNLMEPDEWDYQHIAQSLNHTSWPTWHGKIYFEKYPAFIFLGFWISKLLPGLFVIGPYVNLRVISLICDIGILVILSKILDQYKVNQLSKIVTLLIFIFIPIHWFYAHTGTYEIWYNFFAATFFYTFLNWIKKPTNNLSVVAGVSLALAILAKHINVLLLPIFLVYAYHQRKNLRKTLKTFFIIGISTAITLGIALTPLILKKQQSYDQFVTFYGKFFVTEPRAFIAILSEYARKSPVWLSWPVMFLTTLGVIFTTNKKFIKQYPQLAYIFTLLFIDLIYLGMYYVNSRSFILLLPWLTILMGLCIDFISRHISQRMFVLVAIFAVTVTLAQGKVAFDSSKHQSYEIALEAMRQFKRSYPNFALYDTVDPKKTAGSLAPYEVELINQNATQSAIILTDEIKAPLMLNLTEPEFQLAKKVMNNIITSNKPTVTIVDPYPSFPGTLKPNKLFIYVLP